MLWRGKCASTSEAIRDALRKHAPALVRVGLETGLLSNWLTHKPRGMRLPVVCLDARHAKAAHALRLLPVARAQLVSQRQAVANTVRGLLEAFGLKVVADAKGPFAARVREVAEGNDALLAVVEPMLAAWQALREQVAVLDRRLLARAKADATAKRLMTVPGVGVVVSLAYTAVIDDPNRFRRSSSVGTYLGLTPRRQQSGEMDRMGCISKCGDGLLRAYLFEAATVLLTRHPKSRALKEWGLALARRSGLRRAKVAVARKLAVVMHCIGSGRAAKASAGPSLPPR